MRTLHFEDFNLRPHWRVQWNTRKWWIGLTYFVRLVGRQSLCYDDARCLPAGRGRCWWAEGRRRTHRPAQHRVVSRWNHDRSNLCRGHSRSVSSAPSSGPCWWNLAVDPSSGRSAKVCRRPDAARTSLCTQIGREMEVSTATCPGTEEPRRPGTRWQSNWPTLLSFYDFVALETDTIRRDWTPDDGRKTSEPTAGRSTSDMLGAPSETRRWRHLVTVAHPSLHT